MTASGAKTTKLTNTTKKIIDYKVKIYLQRKLIATKFKKLQRKYSYYKVDKYYKENIQLQRWDLPKYKGKL